MSRLRWWALATVGAAQLGLHVVTVRHAGFDGGPPRYGFPLPAKWAGPNSLEVVLCPPAWAVDLLASMLIAAPFTLVAVWALRRFARPFAVTLALSALVATLVLEGGQLLVGDTRFTLTVPREPTARQVVLGPLLPERYAE